MTLTKEERLEVYRETALYPIAVVQDRYNGAYSRGLWIAVADADRLENGATRIYHILEDGPHGGDTDAMFFWGSPPPWVAVGNTPDEAVSALLSAHRITRSEPA